MVAMVTENGRQYRLKYRNCHFGPQFEGLQKMFLQKIDIYHGFKYLCDGMESDINRYAKFVIRERMAYISKLNHPCWVSLPFH